MNEAHKKNVINIVKHHRKHCDGKNCNVSLCNLMIVCQKAGMEFTSEEVKLFM